MNNKYPLITAINQDFNLLKQLNLAACENLCAELREFIKEHVAQTGGHLASNLGVVELTVALLRAFDFTSDRLVWDVGHQSYAWKILTGRAEKFSLLRMKGGISGFPKISESAFDHFGTGHATTSISAALGMAAANKIAGKPGKAIAVIGDGALTGGMAWEALNNISQIEPNLLIILNDNEMSIDRNVGAIANQLAHLRISRQYIDMKQGIKRTLAASGTIGSVGLKIGKYLKAHMRSLLAKERATFCEDYGCRYYGPFDGHDYGALEESLRAIKELKQPVFLHLLTQKGHGYAPAANDPVSYHGVKPFNLQKQEEETEKNTASLPQDSSATATLAYADLTYTDVFDRLMLQSAKANTFAAITAAMASGTGLSNFAKNYPERFFDVGIAEQHAVCFAAGLLRNNVKAVCAIYATFLQRALDAVIHDVCLQNLPVIFAIDRAGLVGEDGATHHGIYDLHFLNNLPNLQLITPSDQGLLASYLDCLLTVPLDSINAPVLLRYPKGKSDLPLALHAANSLETFRVEKDLGRMWQLRSHVTDCDKPSAKNSVLELSSLQTAKNLQDLQAILQQADISLSAAYLSLNEDGISWRKVAAITQAEAVTAQPTAQSLADTASRNFCGSNGSAALLTAKVNVDKRKTCIISNARLLGYVWQAIYNLLAKSYRPVALSVLDCVNYSALCKYFANEQVSSLIELLNLPESAAPSLQIASVKQYNAGSLRTTKTNDNLSQQYPLSANNALQPKEFTDLFYRELAQADRIIILEECSGTSELWAHLSISLPRYAPQAEVVLKTLPADIIIEQGSISELLADYGMDIASIEKLISE